MCVSMQYGTIYLHGVLELRWGGHKLCTGVRGGIRVEIWSRWVYILFPTRFVGAHLLMNSNLCCLICRRPMFQHSWCWPEELVHPAGDQDLTNKDLVNSAEIGVVQQPLHCPCVMVTWLPQCFGDLHISTCWELGWLKPGTWNSIATVW